MFLKHLYNITVILMVCLLAAAISSCSDDTAPFEAQSRQPEGKLIISTSSVASRADDHYVDDPFAEGTPSSEEAINRVEFYFFRNANDSEAAFHHVSFGDVDKQTVAEFTMKIPVDKAENFQTSQSGTEKTAYVYALVNIPAGTSLPADASATLLALQEVRVSDPGFVSAGAPAEFVMRGGNTVTLSENDDNEVTIQGWIPVERLASKVRMFCNIHPYVYLDKDGKTIYRLEGEDEDVWRARAIENAQEIWKAVPYTGGLNSGNPNTFLYFYNFTNNAQIGGGVETGGDTFGRYDWLQYESIDRSDDRVAYARSVVEDVQLADYTDNTGATPKIERSRYPFTHEAAYYSYPNAWNSADIEELHATNVTMRLQWQCVFDRGNGDEVFDENNPNDNYRLEYFYYQIPVNRLAKTEGDYDRMTPNTYYRIKIDIAMLGARELGTPIDVDASWEALPWGSTAVDVSIKNRRYLVVNQTEWTMNNTSHLAIPFSSSHDVALVYCYVNYFRYNEIWGTDALDSHEYENGRLSSSRYHNSPEFGNWLAAADTLPGKKEAGEGLIKINNLKWGNTAGSINQDLYYKRAYFYDSIYDGFTYYPGHEKPKTYQKLLRGRPSNNVLNGNADAKTGWDLFQTTYGMDSIYYCSVDNKEHVINFDHPLVWWTEKYNNNTYYYAPEMKNGRLREEFSRVEVIIKIRQADRPADEGLFEETIYITQYPGMYIEVSHDYSHPSMYYQNGIGRNRTAGNYSEYIIVNGKRINDNLENGTTHQWDFVSEMQSLYGANNNPNMYVIHTTQLSEENPNYVIGDPRTLYYNDILSDESIGKKFDQDMDGTKWKGTAENLGNASGHAYYEYDLTIAEAPRLNEDNKSGRLKYYYPTDETDGAGTKENYIAPVFRLASSFGKILAGKKQEARRRCALYQEAGRPAGRWRLPTRAEIEVLAQLSADTKIPVLFGNTADTNAAGHYWTANGPIDIKAPASSNPSDANVTFPGTGVTWDYSPRCVYDEWYWTKINQQLEFKLVETDTEFKWGDVRKDNPQN